MGHIKIENLSMIFGAKQNALNALEMVKTIDRKEVEQKTNTTIALNNVSFEIEDSELFVIVGLSGSGKSTLIRCLNRLNEPTNGNIYINDENIMALDKKSLRTFRRKNISMVFQHFGLLSHRTIIRNVEYGLEIQGVDQVLRRKKALEALKVVGLEGQETKYPHELSGGMKQRVGIARALISEPDILLMDEPYSALDPLIRRDMQNELLNLEDYINRTIVFITHDMNEAFKMGDRIALMKDAEVVQIGTPQDFFENPANDYVRDFISDVDKTQVIKVRSVMYKKPLTVDFEQSRGDAFTLLEQKGLDHAFVVENGFYKGMVLRDDLAKSRSKDIKDLIINVTPVLRNDYLKSLWQPFENHEYTLPVTNSKGVLKGAVSKEDLIKTLA
ncbi:MAG: betaine/proline/choline family ABC transporter ATP-binding protein [Acholeplasma sp.]|nr:betaine/proline/choline family ABC transporter ATP-binding protein [Acholeplasma sp.]